MGCSQNYYGPLSIIDYIIATSIQGCQNGTLILGYRHEIGVYRDILHFMVEYGGMDNSMRSALGFWCWGQAFEFGVQGVRLVFGVSGVPFRVWVYAVIPQHTQ